MTKSAYWFVLGGDHLILLDEQGAIPYGPLASALPDTLAQHPFEPFDEHHGHPCYLVDLGIGNDAHPHGMTPLRLLLDNALFNLAGKAWQLITFKRTHRFCGECAAPMSRKSPEWAHICPQGHIAYPRLSPCIIVTIRKGVDILLALHQRHAHQENPMYTVLAGFVEPGETLEQCVAREVFEECGIRVNNIRYVASQPWPFPHSLMMGFTAEYESGEIQLQRDEIADAAFFNRQHLPHLPPHGTIARRLIELSLYDERDDGEAQ